MTQMLSLNLLVLCMATIACASPINDTYVEAHGYMGMLIMTIITAAALVVSIVIVVRYGGPRIWSQWIEQR